MSIDCRIQIGKALSTDTASTHPAAVERYRKSVTRHALANFLLVRYSAAPLDPNCIGHGARLENVRASVLLLADLTAAEIEKAKSGIEHESLAIPLPGLAVAVNPTAVPGLGVSGLGR